MNIFNILYITLLFGRDIGVYNKFKVMLNPSKTTSDELQERLRGVCETRFSINDISATCIGKK